MNWEQWLDDNQNGKTSELEVLSFTDYMTNVFAKNPLNESRPTYKYLADMLNFYGRNSDGSFKLFQKEHPDCPPVFGQVKVQQMLFQNIQNFEEEGFNNKFILLVGPNGSSKSSLVRKLIKGAEEYSEGEEGKLYTFSWIFPIDNFVKGSLGLNQKNRDGSTMSSYAQPGRQRHICDHAIRIKGSSFAFNSKRTKANHSRKRINKPSSVFR